GFVPAFFVLAFGLPIWLVALSALAIGVCFDIFGVLWDTALQMHVPKESLSRVSAYDQLGSVALGPLGLAVGGPAAAAFGLTPTLIAGGFLTALVNAAALISPSVRNLPLGPLVPSRQPILEPGASLTPITPEVVQLDPAAPDEAA